MTQPKTTVQLSRAVECNGRMVDHVSFAGAPGDDTFPVTDRDGQFQIDALEVASVIVRRTGLSKPAIERMATVDLLTIMLALFLPAGPRAEIVSIDQRRKARK